MTIGIPVVNTRYFLQRIQRLLRGRADFRDAVSERRVLCEQEVEEVPPAIFDQDALSGITGVDPGCSMEHEMRRIRGGTSVHAPTVAYSLDRAVIVDGWVYWRSHRHPYSKSQEPLLVKHPFESLDCHTLTTSVVSSRYFGHWLTDEVTLSLLCADLPPPVSANRDLSSHQTAYAEIFGIAHRGVTSAKFRQLVIVDDYGQNSLKRARYQHMRARIAKRFPRESYRGVMLLRGTGGVKRDLVNEQEIADFVSGKGFSVVDPTGIPIPELLARICGARLVIGVEGSQLVHGLLSMASPGALITLQPPFRFNNILKDFADCMGFRYGFVVGSPHEGGFRVEVRQLEKMIESAESAL